MRSLKKVLICALTSIAALPLTGAAQGSPICDRVYEAHHLHGCATNPNTPICQMLLQLIRNARIVTEEVHATAAQLQAEGSIPAGWTVYDDSRVPGGKAAIANGDPATILPPGNSVINILFYIPQAGEYTPIGDVTHGSFVGVPCASHGCNDVWMNFRPLVPGGGTVSYILQTGLTAMGPLKALVGTWFHSVTGALLSGPPTSWGGRFLIAESQQDHDGQRIGLYFNRVGLYIAELHLRSPGAIVNSFGLVPGSVEPTHVVGNGTLLCREQP